MAKIPKPTQKELEKWLDNWEKMEIIVTKKMH